MHSTMSPPVLDSDFCLATGETNAFPQAHIVIADDVRTVIRKSFRLYITRGLDPSMNSFARLIHSVSAQLFVIYSGHFNIDVNSVQDGTGNQLLIFGNDSRRTGTGFLCFQVISA
jgi:hypothetical protein